MHVLSPVLVVSALAAMSVPVHALDAWTVGVERGLPTYALTTEAGEVRLVCDPDRVFGPTPNGALVVRFDKDAAPDMVVVLAKSNCFSESIWAVRFRKLMGHGDESFGGPSTTSTHRTPRKVSSGSSHTVMKRPLAVR